MFYQCIGLLGVFALGLVLVGQDNELAFDFVAFLFEDFDVTLKLVVGGGPTFVVIVPVECAFGYAAQEGPARGSGGMAAVVVYGIEALLLLLLHPLYISLSLLQSHPQLLVLTLHTPYPTRNSSTNAVAAVNDYLNCNNFPSR